MSWSCQRRARRTSPTPTTCSSSSSRFIRTRASIGTRHLPPDSVVFVFYHMTIVVSGRWLFKTFVKGLRSTHCREFILDTADPFTSLEPLKYYLTLAMSCDRFYILCHSWLGEFGILIRKDI